MLLVNMMATICDVIVVIIGELENIFTAVYIYFTTNSLEKFHPVKSTPFKYLYKNNICSLTLLFLVKFFGNVHVWIAF